MFKVFYQTASATISATNTTVTTTTTDFHLDQSTLIDFFVKSVEALIILVALLTVGRIIKGVAFKLANRASHNPNVSTLLSNLAYISVIVICIIWVLSIYTGTGLSSLITLLGIISVAISLSVQDVLKNFVAGIFLLLEQPFRIGDRIQVQAVVGKVQTIEIRTTKLITDEGLLVIIPNGIVFTEIVTNRTASEETLITLYLTLKPDQSISEISPKVREALREFIPKLISATHPPIIRLESVTDGVTKVLVEFWTMRDAPRTIASDAAAVISKALPQVDLNTIKV